MYSPLSSFSTNSSPSLSASPSLIHPPTSSASSVSSVSSLSSLSSVSSISSPSFTSSPRSRMVRKNSVVGVEVVNLILKKSPPRTKRIIEMSGVEEITLENSNNINNNNANTLKNLKLDDTKYRPMLQVRETEEISIILKRGEIQRPTGALKIKQEINLGHNNNSSIVEESTHEEMEVHLSVENITNDNSEDNNNNYSNDNNIDNNENYENNEKENEKIVEEIDSETEEEVTLSLSSLSLNGKEKEEKEGKGWIVDNANKYGPVLVV